MTHSRWSHLATWMFLSATFGAAQTTAPAAELAEVQRLGHGSETLVLLPCMSGRWRSFDRFMERNSDRYTMYAVTVPGFGGSPVPKLPRDTDGTPWRANAIAALARLFREREIDSAFLVGHSWGSTLAVEFAWRHPDKVLGIFNLDGFIHKAPNDEKLTQRERLREAATVRAHYGEKFEDPEEWATFNRNSLPSAERRALYHGMFMATDRGALLQYWRENALMRLNDMLRGLECPVLDLYAIPPGTKDREAVDGARRRELADIGVDAIVTTVTWFETTHFVHETRPKQVDRAIAAFVRGEPVEPIDR